MADIERRVLGGHAVTLRAEGESKPGTLAGYAAVYYREDDPGTEYELWRYGNERCVERCVERIMPGAFDRAMREADDCRCLFNHEANAVLGRCSSGTMRLSVDATGLQYSCDLPDTQAGKDVASLVARGDVSGSSFGFRVEKQTWEESQSDNGLLVVRNVQSVRLFDVGPVTFPAYASTTAGARTADHIEEAKQAYEEYRKIPAEVEMVKARARAVEVAVKS